ncbi:protein DOWNY MILDEW RESISTANCE 6-like [Prunus yedoensis var. nudiflora]|uniref:Protein DOWNY MILDEW RESISTANCE 6-like n=1 Tax=Prunus yedoensis var. nudiflora TaxID=2094558 RepID=A0A314UVX8_PRUYE|nr:protein DOWNY MILDEW RESISTANCE 6-like [Prunus yedoensis var. nudiflora]
MNSLVPVLHPSQVTTIDVTQLHHDSHTRSVVVKTIHDACQKMGIFQVKNHGVSKEVTENALGSLSKFFDLPMDQKTIFLSDDVNKPVRFGTFPIDNLDRVSREFIKIYAYPIDDWIGSWPHNPMDFRENLGKYAIEVRRLSLEIMEAIVESLGLPPTNLRSSLEKGMHMIVGNKYPQCSPSSNILGLASHTDHTIITILLESMSGLEIMDSNDNNAWKSVPATGSTLKVLIGNRLEVLGNGLYKSVFHRVTSNAQMSRVSIGSCLSFPMEEMVEPAMELVDEEHPKRYRASSLEEYIKFLSSKADESYIESLKI